jgi:hypothetical protein
MVRVLYPAHSPIECALQIVEAKKKSFSLNNNIKGCSRSATSFYTGSHAHLIYLHFIVNIRLWHVQDH